jgi:outer membrane receptor protein involved in Fe transport
VGSTVPNSQYLFQSGANLGLKPETSTSWTAGISYIPPIVPEFQATATYYHIDYKNRITQPITILKNALSDPVYAPFVVTNPSTALQSAVIGQANEFLSAAGPYDPSKVLAILNDTYQNAASQSAHGVDLLVEGRWSGQYGNLRITANAAWEHLTQKLTATSAEQTLSGIVFSPPDFKARFGTTWNKGAWSASSFLNYVGDETDTTQLSNVHVSSWTTVDAQVRCDLSNLGKVTRGTGISVSVRNAFDRDPPKIGPNSTLYPGLQYDTANASPIGRFVTLAIDKAW